MSSISSSGVVDDVSDCSGLEGGIVILAPASAAMSSLVRSKLSSMRKSSSSSAAVGGDWFFRMVGSMGAETRQS